MQKCIPTWMILIGIIATLPAWANQAKELSWDDLVPADLVKAEDPLADLTQEQKETVYWVLDTLENFPERGPDTEEYYKEIDEVLPDLEKAGIDIAQLLKNKNRYQTEVVESLNGQQVRIPGYLLPLEMSGTRTTEFLLVPYVGACIHVPPPPLNQIVYVKTANPKGYQNSKLFEPVWVEGKLSVKAISKDLFLIDGSTGVDIGYTMSANHIEPYQE